MTLTSSATTARSSSVPTSHSSAAARSPEAPQKVPFADCWITPGARAAALRVLASGWVTTGRETSEFEAEFARYVGAEHAVAVSSCTAALELSLRSLRLEPGACVLTSAVTFCGAVQAIVHAGLTPVLVDVDPATGMPTEETTRRAADGCCGAAAMVVVHYAGDPADVPALAAAAGLPPARVVEDAAHALGTDAGSMPVGAGGTACFSFYATKNLPIGEGGMVTTDDPERAQAIRVARLHGMSADAWRRYLPGGSWRYDVEEPGLKANMTDVQAVIGREQLKHLGRWQARREVLAARYDSAVSKIDGLLTPHRPPPGSGRHAWHLYPVQVAPGADLTRDELVTALTERGIGTSVHFIPIHHLAYFRTVVAAPRGGLPGADTFFDRVLSLPMYPRVSDRQVDMVTDALDDVFAGCGSKENRR
jgi:dTDP-4-amino-4,6-dideoxygalactose transaminase